MTPEIRRAALRIAAKTALVVTIGCSGGSSSTKATPPANTGGTAAAVVACDVHLGGLTTIEKDKLAADDPLKERMDVYGKVFANVADRTAPRTQECCNEQLAADGASSAQRWECCSALPANSQAMACTPWGPPCPPEMPALA
ncbi:MAG: hypothetical protein JNL83_01210 [Myxococcales bacterium]|nr:hypothetical protein [Myxococcales bacterium]